MVRAAVGRPVPALAIRRTGPGPDEAYGLGAGGAWAAKHGFGGAVSDPDQWAAAQVLASLRAVRS